MTSVFIEPCDIVFFRDDLPFGAAGNQVGRCQFPPRPSVIAGALRTRVLVDQGVHFDGFRTGRDVPPLVGDEIGRVGDGRRFHPGTFRLSVLALGHSGQGAPRTYYRPGRDLVGPGKTGQAGAATAARPPTLIGPAEAAWVPGESSLGGLRPLAIAPGLAPVSGWLDAAGHVAYLAGRADGVVPARESDILDWEYRVGIGLDPATRVVDEGRLFSSRGLVLRPGWGFVAAVEGCSLLRPAGLVRLGGDGRMAWLSSWPAPEPDWAPVLEALRRSGRFRWVLQTPAIFLEGWRSRAIQPDGDGWVYVHDGFRARLVSVATGAPELAGGWDLVRRGPKPFRLMVPAGSVYWFEILDGTADDAWRLFHGQSVSDERASEGFGLVHIGGW